MEEELKKPVCPYCKTEMIPTKFRGYYDEFEFWACECKDLKTEDVLRGAYR